MVQIRKLVKSGVASHTISLPKDWIMKNKLKKGDMLYIDEKDNNILISTETKDKPQDMKEVFIEVDNKELNTIRRKAISSYINNNHIFVFHGQSLNNKLEDIKKILDNFLALEIIDQSATKLVAKDFLNLKEFSLPKTLRRMDMLTRSILLDVRKGDHNSLCLRDFEVDKLFFLISRLVRSNLSDPESEIDNIKHLSTWWMAKNLESVSDAGKKISKGFKKDISKMYDKAEEYYRECVKAYFKNDKELADKLIDERIKLLEECDKLKAEERFLLKEMINKSRNIAKIILDSND